MTLSLLGVSAAPTELYKERPSFEFRYHDKEKNVNVFGLNVKALRDDECHMFYSPKQLEESLITTALQYFTMHPKTALHERFNIQMIKCEGVELFWCSFPIKFKDVCEKAGKVYGMQMKIMPRVMLNVPNPFKTSERPALTLADDYKERAIFMERASETPVKKDALALRTKTKLGIAIEFPEADNILCFQGKRSGSIKAWDKEMNKIVFIGNSLHELGID